jgi:NAD(P)-dependent dehydrogenase (short-subunit alcohol dehydrogenase family)
MLIVTHHNQRTAVITSAGSGLGRDIALRLAAKDYRVFSAAVSSDVSLDFKHASGDAITLSRFDMAFEV